MFLFFGMNTNNYVGGGSYGLMGAIAQTIHEGGGKVIGVIPAALKKIERPGKLSFTTFPPTPSLIVTFTIRSTMCPPSFNGHAGSFLRKPPRLLFGLHIFCLSVPRILRQFVYSWVKVLPHNSSLGPMTLTDSDPIFLSFFVSDLVALFFSTTYIEIGETNNDLIYGEERVVPDMHTRKAMMNKLVCSLIY